MTDLQQLQTHNVRVVRFFRVIWLSECFSLSQLQSRSLKYHSCEWMVSSSFHQTKQLPWFCFSNVTKFLLVIKRILQLLVFFIILSCIFFKYWHAFENLVFIHEREVLFSEKKSRRFQLFFILCYLYLTSLIFFQLERLSDKQCTPESQLKFILEAWLQVSS